MREIEDRLADVDRVEFPRELWGAAVDRAAHGADGAGSFAPPARPTIHRIVTIAVALAVFAAATLVLWDALGPGSPQTRPGDTTPVDDPLSGLSAGWNELPAPPDVRSGAAIAWTGSRLLVWGGYVYTGFGDEEPLEDGYLLQVETGEHEPLFASPLAPRAYAASAWTGSELLVWGGSDLRGRFFDDGAAYDPIRQAWRRLTDAPLSGREPFSVWTGTELVVWGSRSRDQRLADGAAYDPQTDAWRAIADAPAAFTDATAVWTGNEMIVLGSALDERNAPETATAMGMAYDPVSDRWRTLPETRLSPNASTAAWDGGVVVAWDYLNDSQTYDPATNEWSDVSPVPLDEGECSPKSVPVSGAVVGDYCGQTALLDRGEWSDITQRPYVAWGFELVATETAALLLGSNVDTGSIVLLAYRVGAPETGGPGKENAWCKEGVGCSEPSEGFESAHVPYEHVGPEHCGWQSETFIAFERGQYVQDEDNDLTSEFGVRYDADATLPPDARNTGWHSGDRELWVDETDRDETGMHLDIYVVSPDGVQRWPRFDVGCA